MSAWTRSKQAGGEQACTVEDLLVTISIGYSVCSKSFINMFQASGLMPSYELMKSAEQNEVLNKIVSGKKVFY